MTRAIRSRNLFIVVATLLVFAFLALGAFTLTNLATRLEAANDRNSSKDEQLSEILDDLHASQENAQRLYDQLLALGESPEGEAPDDVVTVAPENGRDGDDGDDGRDAPAPTQEQLLAAVQQCFAAGLCAAPKGDKGDTGATGGFGPAGQDSNVPGPQGSPGADGRGIQSLYCDDITGRWTVTYTDTTTADAGVCIQPLLGGNP